MGPPEDFATLTSTSDAICDDALHLVARVSPQWEVLLAVIAHLVHEIQALQIVIPASKDFAQQTAAINKLQ